jgi:hypothetical protein
MLAISFLLFMSFGNISAFLLVTRQLRRLDSNVHRPPSASSTALFFDFGEPSSLAVADTNLILSLVSDGPSSWRQYVTVAVIGLVLIDILLGSPVANSVLNKARRQDDGYAFPDQSAALDEEEESKEANRRRPLPASRIPATAAKPRIDVDAYAKAALARAEGVTQLREYLESRKTDYDRMEDMKRRMDQKMEELDRKNRSGADD